MKKRSKRVFTRPLHDQNEQKWGIKNEKQIYLLFSLARCVQSQDVTVTRIYGWPLARSATMHRLRIAQQVAILMFAKKRDCHWRSKNEQNNNGVTKASNTIFRRKHSSNHFFSIRDLCKDLLQYNSQQRHRFSLKTTQINSWEVRN